MALANFVLQRVEVKHGDTVVCAVRGLALDDISLLVRSHLDALNTLFDLAVNSTNEFGTSAFFMQMATSAPNVAFDAIALAADEPDYTLEARKMPLGLQIRLLQEIARLTFEDVGGPLALVNLVKQMLGDQQKLIRSPATIQ